MTQDIAATYRGPGKVMRRLLAMGENEGRALAILLGTCVVMFVAQWPRLAREAHMDGTDRNALLAGALLGWVIIAPLFFYAVAWIVHLIARLLGGAGSGFASRLSLFWSLAAASPLFLLLGLTAGFVGEGLEQQIVGVLWIAVFLWFWVRTLMVAHRKEAPA